MIDVDELTLHWLAGLLEGEGSFCVGLPSHPNSASIHIKMVDVRCGRKSRNYLGG